MHLSLANQWCTKIAKHIESIIILIRERWCLKSMGMLFNGANFWNLKKMRKFMPLVPTPKSTTQEHHKHGCALSFYLQNDLTIGFLEGSFSFWLKP